MSFYDVISGPGHTPLASDVNQFGDALTAGNDVGTLQLLGPVAAPSSAPTANAGTSGVLTGAYKYLITFVTGYKKSDNTLVAQGETTAGTASGTVNPSSQRVNLTAIPTGPAGTIARNIYRTKAGGGTYYLLYQIPDNAITTYTDNTADGSLPATQPPTTNNTGSSLAIRGVDLAQNLSFLDIVQKTYNNITIVYTYSSNVLTSIAITGDITASITYTYSSGVLQTETVHITAIGLTVISKIITTTYTYTSGVLTGESRAVS